MFMHMFVGFTFIYYYHYPNGVFMLYLNEYQFMIWDYYNTELRSQLIKLIVNFCPIYKANWSILLWYNQYAKYAYINRLYYNCSTYSNTLFNTVGIEFALLTRVKHKVAIEVNIEDNLTNAIE